jgi:hypothetical protein
MSDRHSNNGADGLRAVRESTEPLPDLCHHAEYRIHVNGQYVESAGSLGRNAERIIEFWKRRRRGHTVEAYSLACRVPGCSWSKS